MDRENKMEFKLTADEVCIDQNDELGTLDLFYFLVEDEAFEKLEQTSEVLQKTYDLFKNIYGEDGSKFADKLAEKLSNKIFKVNLEGHYDGNNNTQESGTSSVPDAGE
jgi:hypothetical protein